MNVNDEKLKKLIAYVTSECYYCPLSHGGGLGSCDKGDESCEELMLEWLQEFDAVSALEAGAHIVNDKIIFPPEEIPYEPCYGTPCEVRNERGKASMDCDECEYNFSCPYSA